MLALSIAAGVGAAFAIFYFWPPRITPVSRATVAKYDEKPELE